MIIGEYDERVAGHYAAYRPPLHELILQRVLSSAVSTKKFEMGLDIGCGTGCSARALKRFCGQVYGIEPEACMLSRALEAPGIRYLEGSAEDLSILPGKVDIVTFAGSLFYARSPSLMAELGKVCRPGALLIAYDFQLDLRPVLECLALPPNREVSNYDYDHACHFEPSPEFLPLLQGQERREFDLGREQLVHLLLSCPKTYLQLLEYFGDLEGLGDLLAVHGETSGRHRLEAATYFAMACRERL